MLAEFTTAEPVTDRKVRQPTLAAGLESICISTVHAGNDTSFVVSEAGELFAWGDGGHGSLATGTRDDRRTSPGRVGALRSVKVRSLCGDEGLVASPLICNSDSKIYDEEFYTRGFMHISDDFSDDPSCLRVAALRPAPRHRPSSPGVT